MSKKILDISSKDEWLSWRKRDVTSTEVSCLFDLSPYKTAYELFYEKTTNEVVNQFTDNERMKWGRRLEDPIAYGIADDFGWSIEKFNVYIRDEEKRIGSSFDFKITSQVEDYEGEGILEIKTVSELQYKNKWGEDSAPEYIELQLQHQLHLSGLKWGVIAALVGGNTIKIIFRKKSDDICREIENRVALFWERVDNNNPPRPDYIRDADMILKLNSHTKAGEIIDVSTLPHMNELILRYVSETNEISRREEIRSAIKAEIIDKIGNAEKIIFKGGSISTGYTKEVEKTIITPDMVGKEYGGRRGFRNFRLNLKKETVDV